MEESDAPPDEGEQAPSHPETSGSSPWDQPMDLGPTDHVIKSWVEEILARDIQDERGDDD